MNILIIEDDVFLAERIGKVFQSKIISNRIKILHSYKEFIDEISILSSYDIILTDLKLSSWEGEMDGYKIIRLIRERTAYMPIVVISGFSDIEKLRHAFECGASDYIIKPIRLRELEIRVLNWFKNHYLLGAACTGTVRYYQYLAFDLDNNEFYLNETLIPLTRNNKYLLSLFFANPERVLAESFFAEKLWGDACMAADKNVRVNILRLKQALSAFGIDSWIRNIRGEGYMFSWK